ncbi:MAG: hypothetical protein ABJB05_02850 [Parafilimonas sp.]
MDKRQQLEGIEKMIRELEDAKNSQTSLLKKIAQIEADNINIGIDVLDKSLGDIHERTDGNLESLNQLTEKLEVYRDDFVKKHKLDVPEVV